MNTICFYFNFLLFLFLIYYLYNLNKISIVFLDNFKLSKILISDDDKFYSSLSLENLKLRNINNKDYFLLNIQKYLYTPNSIEKKIIINAIYKAHNLLKNIKFYGFNYNKLKNYKWIIGCSYGQNYEFGYPHTRNNIIILNYNNIYDCNLYKTLIHERIHIYQKLFPKDIKKYLDFNNYKFYSICNNTHLANPDTDNYIYIQNNIILECNIISANTIQYTNYDSKYEHPYEYMAYEIVDLITK